MATYKDLLKSTKVPATLAKAHGELGRLVKRFDDWTSTTTRQLSVGLVVVKNPRPAPDENVRLTKAGYSGAQVALMVEMFITPGGQASFMAYESGGKVVVRDEKSAKGNRLNDDAPVAYDEDELDPSADLAEAIVEKLRDALGKQRDELATRVTRMGAAIADLSVPKRDKKQMKYVPMGDMSKEDVIAAIEKQIVSIKKEKAYKDDKPLRSECDYMLALLGVLKK